MAMVGFSNGEGLYLEGIKYSSSNAGSVTLNSVNEYSGIVGKCYLEGGTGSKTISSSGGKILRKTSGAVTFSNASTNLRIGIQDVNASGRPDGTWDVYADLVGGTDTIPTSNFIETSMETGTKTISHGDLVSINIQITSYGGTDSIPVATNNLYGNAGTGFPYGVANTGSASRTYSGLSCTIMFDDGTIGWIETARMGLCESLSSSQSFNSSSNPAYYGVAFKTPVKMSVTSVGLVLGSVATADNFRISLFSDPYGTPVEEKWYDFDADYFNNQTSVISGYANAKLQSEYTLNKDTWYCVALKPTTTNNISFYYNNILNQAYKKQHIFGQDYMVVSRSTSGAFSNMTNSYVAPLGLIVSKLDNGAGSSGGSFGFCG